MGVAANDQAGVSHFGYGTFLGAYGDTVIEYTFSEAGEC
jgi:hypothetical protein